MAIVCSPYHRGSTQSSDMAWYWWLTSQNVKNKGSCRWQLLTAEHVLPKPRVWRALLSFHHSSKYAHLHVFSGLSRQDDNQSSTLSWRPLCAILPQPVYSMSPSRVKHTRKRGVPGLESIHRKRRFTSFPSPAGTSLKTSLFSPRESLVVTSRLETGNSRTFFYGVANPPIPQFFLDDLLQKNKSSLQWFFCAFLCQCVHHRPGCHIEYSIWNWWARVMEYDSGSSPAYTQLYHATKVCPPMTLFCKKCISRD